MPEYDAITPAQWVLFLWTALIAFTLMWLVFWRTGRSNDAPIERDEAGALEIINRSWEALLHWRPVMTSAAPLEEDAQTFADDENDANSGRTNFELEPANLANSAAESRTEERTGSFVLNPAEQVAVQKMIIHRTMAEKPTKASTILEGFGIKKGDSAAYRRASEIYDYFFVLAEPLRFPNRTIEQEEERRKLGLVV
jgi:hypothetical protein